MRALRRRPRHHEGGQRAVLAADLAPDVVHLVLVLLLRGTRSEVKHNIVGVDHEPAGYVTYG